MWNLWLTHIDPWNYQFSWGREGSWQGWPQLIEMIGGIPKIGVPQLSSKIIIDHFKIEGRVSWGTPPILDDYRM